MAPVAAELGRRRARFEHALVHTGQHYDEVMSELFLTQLGLGAPDFMLSVGSGSHAAQTARIMERLEPVLLEYAPDMLLVSGDVNSTLAATLVAAKLGVPVGHVEAGLRSFDRTMPEEINRVVTDQLSDLLFTHSPEARDHLKREGVDLGRVHAVGNTMIDTLVAMGPRVEEATERVLGDALAPGGFLVVTLHRPALVDGELLREAIAALRDVAQDLPVVFPVHPRTQAAIERAGLDTGGIDLRPPLGYLEFSALVRAAAGVLTDSGGIQEETTFLGIPCFTLRANTERPVTVSLGTNTLLGLEPARIREVPGLLRASRSGAAASPPGWDGRAAERLVDVLAGEPRP